MLNLRDHKDDIVEIANCIGHYTVDFAAEPYARILDSLEETISSGWAKTASGEQAHHAMQDCHIPREVQVLATALHNDCCRNYPPLRQGGFGYYYKNRHLSKLADIAISKVFRSNGMFLQPDIGLHGQLLGAIFEVLRLMIEVKIVKQFANTLFIVQDGDGDYADTHVTKSYAQMVGEQTLCKITTQAKGLHGRTIISAYAKFADTADPRLVTTENIVVDKDDSLGLGVSGYVIFDELPPGKQKYRRSGTVVLQTCIDHGLLEENEMFVAMNQMFDECVGGDYPILAGSRQTRAASALLLVLKLMK